MDPNFVGLEKAGRQRPLELMVGLVPFKIRFVGMEGRPNDLDEEVLTTVTIAGLRNLLLGIERGSPRGSGQSVKAHLHRLQQ
jgi:hypothetical protein